MALDKGTIQGSMPVFLLFNDLVIIHNDSRALLCLPTIVLQVRQLRIGQGKLGGGGVGGGEAGAKLPREILNMHIWRILREN